MPDRPLSPTPSSPMLLTRRGVLGLGLGAVAAAVLASCTPAPQSIEPRLVSTPTARPDSMVRPVTSVS